MEEELPDRLFTVPNLLSVLRLAGVPLFLWLLLGPKEDGWALAVLVAAGISDWADGKAFLRGCVPGGPLGGNRLEVRPVNFGLNGVRRFGPNSR